MFARVTKYKMKPDSTAAATEMMDSLKPKIMGMPGMLSFLNVMQEDGNGYVISVVESEATSNANAANVAGLWANFADFMEAPPQAEGYDVIADWKV